MMTGACAASEPDSATRATSESAESERPIVTVNMTTSRRVTTARCIRLTSMSHRHDGMGFLVPEVGHLVLAVHGPHFADAFPLRPELSVQLHELFRLGDCVFLRRELHDREAAD